MTTAPDALFPGKHFISTVLEALDTKTRMTGALAQRYLMRAAMAGMIVAVFYVVNYAIVGVFDGLHLGGTSMAGVGKTLGALSFGPALVFIYYTKSELLTSNMMVVVIGYYYKPRRPLRGPQPADGRGLRPLPGGIQLQPHLHPEGGGRGPDGEPPPEAAVRGGQHPEGASAGDERQRPDGSGKHQVATRRRTPNLRCCVSMPSHTMQTLFQIRAAESWQHPTEVEQSARQLVAASLLDCKDFLPFTWYQVKAKGEQNGEYWHLDAELIWNKPSVQLVGRMIAITVQMIISEHYLPGRHLFHESLDIPEFFRLLTSGEGAPRLSLNMNTESLEIGYI